MPSYSLMCRAAEALLDIVQLRWSDARRVLIVCGGGNNGGDGYVLARLLARTRVSVSVFAVVDPANLTGDARLAYEDYSSIAGEMSIFSQWPEEQVFDLIVDAMFGSGLCREVSGKFARVIELINNSGAAVLSVDVPSGLDASNGSVLGTAVTADVTMTFIGRKRGLLTHSGPDFCGRIFLDELQVPPGVFSRHPSDVFLIDQEQVRELIPTRINNAHKGSFDGILLIGGDKGMPGAVILAAEAALRTGAGLVRTATREKLQGSNVLPDIITIEGSDHDAVKSGILKAGVLAIGPGLGTSEWAKRLLHLALASELPSVIDADALNIVASNDATLGANAIMTPHPAEAARLLGITTQQVQTDRFAAVEAIARQYSAVVVLKGCGSLICNGEKTFLCDAGNSGMSCAGMGDVLTGVIAGLLAQGLSPLKAAILGVHLHANAGDVLFRQKGNSLLASDVLNTLPEVMLLSE